MKLTVLLISTLCIALCTFSVLATEEWVTDVEKTDFDRPPLPEQKKSLIDWQTGPDKWLSFDTWKLERTLKDQEPGWKVRQRLAQAPERIGKVLSCIGDCRLYRGSIPTPLRWQSRVHEGDEIHTGHDSYLWLLLADGGLVRIAPRSAIAMLEINVTKEKVFYQARLNNGYVLWLPRSGRQQKLHNLYDTDPLFLPLLEQEANLSWYQRQVYQGMKDEEQSFSVTSPEVLGLKQQQARLNQLIGENNKFAQKKFHEVFLVTPNGSLHARDQALLWFYGEAKMSYVKLLSRDEQEEGERPASAFGKLLFRGYVNTTQEELPIDKWMSVDQDGRSVLPMAETPQFLELSEVLYRRLTTVLLARELAVARQESFWTSAEDELATNWGYRLWAEDQDQRFSFLVEYTRRLETSNLRSLQRLTEAGKLAQASGPVEFAPDYFSAALESYYQSIKQKHSLARESTRDMVPVHYYGWLLKNARQK